VWGKVRYLDPSVVEGSVDWDAALMAALPAALAATNDDDEAAAVRLLLAALHDPATRVDVDLTPIPAKGEKNAPTRVVDGVPVIPVAADTWQDIAPTAERLEKELATAKVAVIDLRGSTDVVSTIMDRVAPRIAPHDALSFVHRFVEHRGYRPQSGVTSGSYRTLLAADLPVMYPAATTSHPTRLVFVTNQRSGVPDLAWALQRTRDAVVVLQGPSSADQLAQTAVVTLGGAYRAHLRRGQLTEADPRPDATLPASASDEKVIDVAVKAALHGVAPKGAPALASGPRSAHPPRWRPDETYEKEAYPARERRLLGLFRMWNVIEYFYPYLPLMGDAWQTALVDFIPRFEAARDAREYALAVTELAARIPDGHVSVWGSKELRPFFGAARAPFEIRRIEGQAVITSLLGDASLAAAGLTVGDVVLSVDGELLETRVAGLSKYIAASNDSWRAFRTLRSALSGDVGSLLKVSVRDANGATREVTVPRTVAKVPPRTGPVYRLLEDGIGYADLDRLENADVDAMFTMFEKTRAIVFDMRGYPRGTAWTVGPRLNVLHATGAAQFYEPLVGPSTADRSFFVQPIGTTDKPLYRGKTVMLVDERTMSQAEHTGLFFEAANGTKFIGSQTAGANGDVTNLSVPGGIFVSFSGHDVRHADGRQLQRIGLVPDIEVHPTLLGLRAGHDEVLERAVKYLHDAE
jgi:C-terminal processing protease CtpA/Prc